MDVPIKCICPPKADGEPRHEQDTVTLPEVLDFRRTIIVRQYIRLGAADEGLSLPELTAIMSEAYLLHCIDRWSVADDAGPIALTKDNVRTYLLASPDEAEKVGDAADEVFSEKVIFPLLVRASTSSPPTPMPEPTSATTPGSPTPKPRKGSKPSSISTTQMAVTGPMAASPGGVSSFSQS